MNFEWDEKKNEINKKKHGISFEHALQVFEDEFRLEEYDENHSYEEERYTVIGMVDELLYVVCTDRPENDAIRLISARFATKAERRRYYGDC
ncbi:MAG: BrnT family toxin [Selenomonadaceae bacterium]|nr:BrnT family toxin [Selenomonadaceae bacterium]